MQNCLNADSPAQSPTLPAPLACGGLVGQPPPLSPDLESILADCDRTYVRLSLSPDGQSITPIGNLTPDLRSRIAAHKPAIIALLARHPVTRPDPVAFISGSLMIHLFPADLVSGVGTVWVGDKPCFRLNPGVWKSLASNLVAATEARKFPPSDGVCAYLWLLEVRRKYLDPHFRPDQFDRATPVNLKSPPQPRPWFEPTPAELSHAASQSQSGSQSTVTTPEFSAELTHRPRPVDPCRKESRPTDRRHDRTTKRSASSGPQPPNAATGRTGKDSGSSSSPANLFADDAGMPD